MFPSNHIKCFVILLVLSLSKVYCDEKCSLTYVIDDTYSMSNEIRQVKESVDAIFNTVLNSHASQIEDFVLVTFNDPETVLRTITRDRDEFKNALSSISVHGGGDCPEYAMNGINEGIRNSRPKSTIYVFTDASAADYNQYDVVKNNAISKQIQVVFILTGLCGSKSSPDYLVYQNLAASTDGQVFNLQKQEIKDILEYVKENIKERRTIDKVLTLPPGKHSVNIIDDGSSKGTIVSATGHMPTVDIAKPDGSKADTKTVLQNNDNIIVKLLEPKPAGVYPLTVGSDSETHVVISSINEINFNHGFSTFKPSSINETTTTPLPDVKSHITIQLTDGDIELKTVQIVDIDKKLIKEVPLTALNKTGKLYTTDLEDLPTTIFRIGITGLDPKSNKNINRFGSPIAPQPKVSVKVKEAPKVSILGSPTLMAKFNESLQLKCQVNGFPKPDIVWVNKDTGAELTAEVSIVKIPNEFISILDINKTLTNTSYRCKANNEMGSDDTEVFVEITTAPFFNIIEKPKDTIILRYHDKGEIHCKVNAFPPASITWYKDRRLLLESDNVEFSDDNSVVTIKKMQPSDDGSYLCEMRNEYQRKVEAAKVIITGIDAPHINKSIDDVELPLGLDAVISCNVIKGFPKPTITWSYYNDSSEIQSLDKWNNLEVITIPNVDKNNSGVYECHAANEIGEDIHEVKLTVHYPPKIEKNLEIYRAAKGDSVKIPCNVDGEPEPTVMWFKDGVPVTKSSKIFIDKDHTIRMTAAAVEDSGTYTCNATNKLGTAGIAVKINVHVPVTIALPKETKMNVKVGSTLNLPCKAQGHPTPKTEWAYYSFNSSVPPKQLLKSNGSSVIKLRDMLIEDEGYYTCTASNSVGSNNATYEIHVLAPPIIENIYLEKQFKAVEGDLVTMIKCNAAGNPPPTIKWLKDGHWVATGHDFSIENGTFIMKNIKKSAEGIYVCEAENSLGVDKDLYQVTVDESPKSGPPTLTITLGEGSSGVIRCDIPHKRTDLLRWYKAGVLIHTGELMLTNPKVSDSGLYTCRVSDFVSSTSGNTMVKVGIKPKFVTDEEENFEYVESVPIVLSCEVTGEPKPKITWRHNGEKMNFTENYLYFDMEVGTHGQYDCEASNEFGSITRSFNINSQDCFIDIRKQPSKLQPLMVSPKFLWPQITVKNGYMSIPKGDYVILICPDRFKTSPKSYNLAFCEGGTKFKFQGQSYDYSNIQCTEKVTHYIERTGESCYTENTELMRVVFKVQSEAIEAYEVCLDLDSNIPLYTTLRIGHSVDDIDYLETEWADKDILDLNIDEAYDCNRQNSVTSMVLGRWFHGDDGCCFGKRMLVNPKDLFPGVAQRAAYSYLNIASHWSTCNAKSNNWNEVEHRVRSLAKESYSELVVSTGVAKALTLPDTHKEKQDIFITDSHSNQQFVPKYLWKVVQDPGTKSSLVIIQVNVPDLLKSQAASYVRCRDICNTTKWMRGSTWYDVSKGYTYCCTLKDFENSFGYSGIFLPYHQVLNDVSLIPGSSMT